MRVLVVEDEAKIGAFIQRALEESHYRVDLASDGHNALIQAEAQPYDLIILDIVLPGKSGFTLCEELRRKKITTPILLLSVKDSLHHKVKGLNLGADDYLTKPFEIEELLARVRALLRRNKDDKSSLLKVADLCLNQLTQEVTRAGKPIELTSREYALLRYLIIHKNEVVTRTMITEHVWGEDSAAFTNVIDVYINHVRKKVDKGFDTSLIHTIRFVGYTLKDSQAS